METIKKFICNLIIKLNLIHSPHLRKLIGWIILPYFKAALKDYSEIENNFNIGNVYYTRFRSGLCLYFKSTPIYEEDPSNPIIKIIAEIIRYYMVTFYTTKTGFLCTTPNSFITYYDGDINDITYKELYDECIALRIDLLNKVINYYQ